MSAIEFRVSIETNVLLYGFELVDRRTGRVWRDVVRTREHPGSSAAVREALTFYNFWTEVKRVAGDDRPTVIADPAGLIFLRWAHVEYCRTCSRDDPWPFSRVGV